jgi:hypothetical protein
MRITPSAAPRPISAPFVEVDLLFGGVLDPDCEVCDEELLPVLVPVELVTEPVPVAAGVVPVELETAVA